MAAPIHISREKMLYPPTYVPIPQSACDLAGPFRCPDCAGVVMLETRQIALTEVLFCPYCLSALKVTV